MVEIVEKSTLLKTLTIKRNVDIICICIWKMTNIVAKSDVAVQMVKMLKSLLQNKNVKILT